MKAGRSQDRAGSESKKVNLVGLISAQQSNKGIQIYISPSKQQIIKTQEDSFCRSVSKSRKQSPSGLLKQNFCPKLVVYKNFLNKDGFVLVSDLIRDVPYEIEITGPRIRPFKSVIIRF